MRGNGDGRSQSSGNGHATSGGRVLDLAHLRAEVERLRTLKAEGIPSLEWEFDLRQTAKRCGFGPRIFRQYVEGRGGSAPGSIEEINTLVDGVSDKPELIVETANLPAAADAVRDLFAAEGGYFEWGGPAKVVSSSDGGLPKIVPLTLDGVVNEVHQRRRPIKLTPGGQRVPCTLPERVPKLYLAKKGEWQLPRLAGITTAPLLRGDGDIRVTEGYDPETGLWCVNVPKLEVPARPTEDQARAALEETLRPAFRTFPFADSKRVWDPNLGLELVDLTKPPGLDESSFLCGLMTAACRPCLHLAPGLMLVAAQISGSGSGKGLLVRAIGLIAFGLQPSGFTPGKGEGELEKRLGADFLAGGPMVFISNVNDAVLRSETLEDAMTERPFKVRLFGTLKMAELDAAPFIVVNGNALTPSRDLVRRFPMFVGLDAKMESPALRRFPLPDGDFLADIQRRRRELQSAVMTIWRFGRQNADALKPGQALGSYSTWERWCRDPLLVLGCRDPVERVTELTSADPLRQNVVGIFIAWNKHHGGKAMVAKDLHEEVKKLIDPPDGVLQRITPRLAKLNRTRLAGFEFSADKDPRRPRDPTTYTLKNLDPESR